MSVSPQFKKAIQQFGWAEPCRVCGEMQSGEPSQKWVGYSKCRKSRTAHDSCFQKNTPQSEWKLQ